MANIYHKTKQREIMSHISGKETKSKILVRKYLYSQSPVTEKTTNAIPAKPIFKFQSTKRSCLFTDAFGMDIPTKLP